MHLPNLWDCIKLWDTLITQFLFFVFKSCIWPIFYSKISTSFMLGITHSCPFRKFQSCTQVGSCSLKYFNHHQIILSIEFPWQMELVKFISDQLPKISDVVGPFVVVCYFLIWSKFTLFHLSCHILATCIWLSFEVHLQS